MDESIINTLQTRISQLEGDCATLRAEAKDRRIKGRGLKEENDTLKTQLATVTNERDTLVTAAQAQPHELQTQVDSLRGQIRDRDHRDRFKTLAQAAGVHSSKALDDLYQLSGYKPEADEIDETKIQAAIGQALQGRDWLKSSAPAPGGANGEPAGAGATAGANPSQATHYPPGPGASRGGASRVEDADADLAAQFPNAFRLA